MHMQSGVRWVGDEVNGAVEAGGITVRVDLIIVGGVQATALVSMLVISPSVRTVRNCWVIFVALILSKDYLFRSNNVQ
ncbi:hypothetical protein B296_00009650 [Ensete ventricosum]|uniref:Uncharacterized protein n=1 Tax=Ensete ventricosum TaxID=4639 RepID=A0A427BAG2_ENSVE|nr:hypothetical protein B296_00009650 [Ensete ventricosum]